MASTYTTNSGIEKPGDGEQSGTWGDTVNTNMDILDTLVSGFVQITAGSTSVTLTTTDGSVTDGMNRAIKYVDGGDLGGNCTVTFAPNDQEKLLFVENGLSASRSLIFSQGSGSNYTLQNGKQAIIRSDGAGSGAAVYGVLTNLEITTLEVTGAAAIDGALTQGGASQFNSTITVGVDDTGYDVKMFGATSGKSLLWDESADSLIVTGTTTLVGTTNLDAVDIDGATQIDGTVTVGVDDTGYDVKFFGATSGDFMLWDESENSLEFPDGVKAKWGDGPDITIHHDGSNSYISDTGTGALYVLANVFQVNNAGNSYPMISATEGAGVSLSFGDGSVKLATVTGGVNVTGELEADSLDIDGATQIDGTVTVGVDDTGYDVKFFGAASGSYMLWDESTDDLILAGAAGLSHAGAITAADAAGPTVLNEAATATNPTLVPNKADPDTGLSWKSANILGMTAGGTNVMQAASTHIGLNGMAPNPGTAGNWGLSLGGIGSTGQGVVQLIGNPTGTGSAGRYGVHHYNSGSYTYIGGTTVHRGANDTSGTMKLQVVNSGSVVSAINITSAGLVGIGTTAPASLLHVAGTVQVGVDDTGHDVKFFGATSGAYLLWDESADDLKLVGAAGLTVAGAVDMASTLNVTGAVTNGSDAGDTRFVMNSANQYTLQFKNAGNTSGHIGGSGADVLRFSNAAGATIMEMNAGQITAPLQPSFYASCAAKTNVTGDATTTYLVGSAGYSWTEVQDRNADFDGAGLFTAPVAGFYHMSGTMQWTGLNTATSGVAYLVVSNGNIQILHNPTNIANVGVNYNVNISQVVYMDASDTSQLAMYINGAGSDVCDLDNAQFSGYLLG